MKAINVPRASTSPISGSRKPALKEAARSNVDMKAQAPAELVANFDLSSAPGHLLRCCHSRARAIFDEIVGRETGLSKQQVALMIAIAQNPSATHALLAEHSGFDRNTLADTLDRLIAKGLVSRERSKRDARAYEIGLTPSGHAQIEAIMPLSTLVQAKILEPVPEELRATFIRCLQLLAQVPVEDLVSETENTVSGTADVSKVHRAQSGATRRRS
jgi:DNA-binding MarR family transcriptional regulator